MFGGFGSRFAKFGTGGGGRSIASPADLLQLFKRGSEDGAMIDELDNTTDLELANVNCLSFDGTGDYIKIESASGIDLTLANNDAFGSCVITATFKYTSNGAAQVIHSLDASSYRVYINSSTFFLNSSTSTGITASSGDLYRITTTYNSSGEVTNFVAENLTDDTTDTFTGVAPAGSHQGAHSFHIGARQSGLSLNGIISNVSVTDSSVGANFHLPLQEGSGTKAYDISGNGNHGTIVNATWSTDDGIGSWNHEYGFASAFANLDGADNKYLKFPLTGLDQSTFDMTMWLEVTDRTASINKWFFSNGASFNSRGIEIKATSSNRLIFSNYFSGGRVDLRTPDATIDGKMYKIDVHFESGNSYLVVDGVKGTVDTTTFTQRFTGTEDFAYIFARNNGLNAGRGIIYKLNINGEEKVLTDAELIGSPTRYNIPALNTKTKQVATFDGVADRLGFTAHTTAVGDVFDFEFDLLSNPDGAPGNHRALLSDSGVRYIAILDNDDGRILVRGSSSPNTTGAIKVADGMSTLRVTIDSDSQVSVSINGGAAETLATDFTGIELNRLMAASAGNVRYVNANVASFSITNSSGNKVVGYDFQNDIGTTNIVDISGNGNDGELDYGSGGLESFWGTRVEDASGTLVSADYATGNTSISNPAALDNDSEVDLVQTDSVFVSGAANFWSADGAAQDEKTFDELITHANTRNGYHRVWVKVLNGRVLTIAQYDLDKNFLPSEVLKNERYFGGTSAALRDVNGDFITDGNGYVIFAA